jgi:hypothetical protein
LFKDFSKLLICGGDGPYTDTCEVINLASSASTCKNLPNFPAKISQAIGRLGFKENPILCGGYQNGSYSNMCYILENNMWVSSYSMNWVRAYAAAAQLQDCNFLVAGGSLDSYSYLRNAEMLTEEGWEKDIPLLPVTFSAHCMVTVNLTTVMVIGGFQDRKYSGKTFYFTFGEERWTEGPELKNKRKWHSCGKIRRNNESQEINIIVAGGSDGSTILSSVEIMDEGSNEWQTGPELPFGIYGSQMVEDQNEGVVLIGGYSKPVKNLDTLYHLPHGGQDAIWTKMEQKMKIKRYSHTAFLVPSSLVDCS